jgi:hypothetical protein
MSKRVVNVFSWVAGRAEGRSLGLADRMTNDSCNSTLISDIEGFKNIKAPKGCSVGVLTSERLGFYPEEALTLPMQTISRLVHLTFDFQASEDFGSHLVLPDGVELMVDEDPELFELAVGLWALRLLPLKRASSRHGPEEKAAQHKIAQLPSQGEWMRAKEKHAANRKVPCLTKTHNIIMQNNVVAWSDPWAFM